MRTIVNISMPADLHKHMQKAIKEHHFASKSEFFRMLMREWMAGRLANDLMEGEKEYQQGKTKKLKSMKDLW